VGFDVLGRYALRLRCRCKGNEVQKTMKDLYREGGFE
jgi:hypothetical protein